MKCLSASALQAQPLNGGVVHDSHAEILAIRLFNHFLLRECLHISQLPSEFDRTPPRSAFVRRRLLRTDGSAALSDNRQPFEIKDGWRIRMYSSEAPCGDASMELTMKCQADATPWPAQSYVATRDQTAAGRPLKGRGHFSELGIVRRKPGRADSPATFSKSCTDKLAIRQCTSLLSSTSFPLLNPHNAYLHSLILPASQHVPAACERAFGPGGRMGRLVKRRWPGGFAYRPFEVESTRREFRFSRRAGGADLAGMKADPRSKASNVAVVWNPYVTEVLIGGILQGRKRGSSRAASVISRKGLAQAMLQVAAAAGLPLLTSQLKRGEDGAGIRYSDIKRSDLLSTRREVKQNVIQEALSGWIANVGDDFDLDHVIQPV